MGHPSAENPHPAKGRRNGAPRAPKIPTPPKEGGMGHPGRRKSLPRQRTGEWGTQGAENPHPAKGRRNGARIIEGRPFRVG